MTTLPKQGLMVNGFGFWEFPTQFCKCKGGWVGLHQYMVARTKLQLTLKLELKVKLKLELKLKLKIKTVHIEIETGLD